MPQYTIRPLSGETRANWIRLRTLIVLRWVAITGQLVAITVATRIYGLQLNLGLCYLVIGASVIANMVSIFIFPENKRLTEVENFGTVLFDLLQLGLLLFLTGGLHNPFALLLLGPVTISATALSLRSVVAICSVAILIASTLMFYYVDLRTEQGGVLQMPGVFLFGNWVALVIAILFTSAYSHRVTTEVHSMSDALAATQLALAREQKLTDLGGVVAAAAHELGTPLATIKLTSSELFDELSDRPDLAEDALLIRTQADRCRDILRDMGRVGKDDLHMRQAPLIAVIEEAAEPHMNRGKRVDISLVTPTGGALGQPSILRQPEIVHGLRNLIQNAVDFATSRVWIDARWTSETISIRIIDDGTGFASSIIGRIGDPFVKRARAAQNTTQRPGYEGMGLGLFIAKTLLERSGAELQFANGRDVGANAIPDLPLDKIGAVVEVRWPRAKIDAQQGETPVPLGVNLPFDT